MTAPTLLPSEGRQVIDGFGPGSFQISGKVYAGSVIVTAVQTVSWPIGSVAELRPESFAHVVEANVRPELLLLGCGAKFALVPRPVRESLRQVGIVVDAMDTRAACRTYNVLIAEERRVAAALIALP